MRVDVWADNMCPWCYMGKRRLEEAADRFRDSGRGEGRELEVVFHSFELAPEIPRGHTQSVLEYNVTSKGMTVHDAEALLTRVTAIGRRMGIDLSFDTALLTNTSLAHQLVHSASTHGLQAQAEEALFAAYFSQGRNISDIVALGAVAGEIGLDPVDAIRSLRSEEYRDAVRADQDAARSLGITSVPFFVIDGKYGLAGSQDTGMLVRALEQAWSDRTSSPDE